MLSMQIHDAHSLSEAQKGSSPGVHLRPDDALMCRIVAKVRTAARRGRVIGICFVHTPELP